MIANHGMRFFIKPCFMQEIKRGGLTVELEIPKTIDNGIPVLLKAYTTLKPDAHAYLLIQNHDLILSLLYWMSSSS